MSGLPWIKVALDVVGHPKLDHFEEIMGLEDGLGVIIRLWTWVAAYCPTGVIPEDRAPPLERHIMGSITVPLGGNEIARLDGRPGPGWCLDALVESGWLERVTLRVTPDVTPTPCYRVHDWDEMQTAHSERARSLNRERQRRFRERNALVTKGRNALVTLPEESRGEEREKKPLPAAAASGNGKAKKETDPRFAPLRAIWEEEFRAVHHGVKYHWSGPADAAGIHRVITTDPEEFRRRARAALQANGFKHSASVAKLTSSEVWNDLAGTLDRLPQSPARWWLSLTAEARSRYLAERRAIDPSLDDAPFGATGEAHAAEMETLNKRWASEAR